MASKEGRIFVGTEGLRAAIKAVLDDYALDVSKNLNEIAVDLGKSAQRLLRQTSPREEGDYAKGWKVDIQAGRLATTVTVYHSTPGLPHLLENGHALRQGGRAPAIPHIAPVADSIEEKFIKELEARL